MEDLQMALYRQGEASMTAEGQVTGVGTQWREPLSLIRKGATIVFLTTPLKLAVINTIDSDTEMTAITTDGEAVAQSKYVILLNDSLTVDGMAQDVAETLRYYQSKETEIEEAIEFFKNFDLKTLQDLVARAEAAAQSTSADRAATEQLKNETNQFRAGALNARNEAEDARDAADIARSGAETAKSGADTAKAGAETARDEARQWAQQVQPENLLHKDQNLNDLANKDLARNNLGIGETDIPVFRGISLTEKNSANSGILYLINKSPEDVQLSYSRIYNEIQGGLAKSTIQVTREGGDTNYYQFDESGNALNYNSITIGRGIGNALGSNSLVIGDTDTGLKWGSDGVLQVYCNGMNVAAYEAQNMHLNGLLNIWPVDNNASGIRVSGSRFGGSNALIGGQVAPGSFEVWRERACGMLVELPVDDAAVNVFKVVRWGGDWAAGLDVARYSAGGCEAHFNVRGAVYGFNDSGYASAVQWVNTSDIRLKANLKEIESAKEKVKSIKGYTYFKRNNLDEDEYSFYSEEAGVIAQDVQTVLPEAVYKISDSEYLGVSYGGVTALLVNAINEMIDDSDKQNKTIQAQQEEIKELKNEIAEMKAAIAEMQALIVQTAK
ncbi:tail fiber protein [Escherichia phage SRT8]|uniref:Tail fiber protein n=1 Tax=Escherichia phage SRT8 TaxID=2496545 RepID=A0A2D1GP48_9CAUD|nr:tail fiber protein [Escherichia phage SRT8]ATN93780.1 tail fiber protein [Escherichia phage SRT8]